MSKNSAIHEPKVVTTDASEERVFTSDGLENLVASMGNNQDKRHASRYAKGKMSNFSGNRSELEALYREGGIAGKVVDIIPDDMTREWRKFTGDIDVDAIKALEEEEDRLQLRHHFNQAHKWARLYGTAFIVLAVDDGLDPSEPLDIENIRPGDLKHIKSIDRHRVSNSEVVPIQDPLDKNYSFPLFYRIVGTSVKIHHSRMLRFDGVMLPFDEFRRNNYNGDSVLNRLYSSIVNFDIAANGAASMVFEASVDVIKVRDLMAYLQTAEGETQLRKRFTLANTFKSFNNQLLLDSEEEFQTKTNTFAGLPDLLDRYGLHIAAVADIPATRLFGSAASGFNATGLGDEKNYYNNIRSKQLSQYKPNLDYFDKLLAKNIGMSDDADLSYEFNALFQVSDKERAETEALRSQRDAAYIDRGVITEVAVAKQLQQDQTYNNISDEEIAELENDDDAALEAIQNELLGLQRQNAEQENNENADIPEGEGN